MTRDVVPQAVEPRGFLRRRRAEDQRPEQPPAPSEPAPQVPAPVPVVEAPRPTAVPVTLAGPVAVHRPPSAPRPEPAIRGESDELLRAKDTLLQAALRQCDELSTALLNERHLRQEETERLAAENQLLRDALSALNAEAVARQQSPDTTPAVAPPVLVPDQRVDPAPSAEPVVVEPQPAGPGHDVASRHGRRRSARQAGPA